MGKRKSIGPVQNDVQESRNTLDREKIKIQR